MDARHRYIANKVAEVFGVAPRRADAVVSANKARVDEVLKANGSEQAAVFTYEIPETKNAEGEWVPSGTTPHLEYGMREGRKITGRVLYFVRSNPKGVGEKTAEADLVWGTVDGETIDCFRAIVSDVFVPVLKEQAGWGKNTQQETTEFLHLATKFSSVLNEAVMSIHSGLELPMPDAQSTDVELKPYAFTKAADNPELVANLESVLKVWCDSIERLLADEARAGGENDGPDTELEYWRARMAKLNSVMEQLKKREARVVLGVLMAARSKVYKQWKAVDVRITDVANEAKDNVKYLITLEKSLEPMYSGTPHNVIDAMPSLMNNIKMMHTIARYYNTPERMTTLLCKVTNQLIANCRRFIEHPGKMWDQDLGSLLDNLAITLRVRERYEEEYVATKHRAAAQARGGGAFAFDESRIFRKFDLFCKRVRKLQSMFTTVRQFSSLAEHTHIEGLEAVIQRFAEIADDMKRKPYDLLDFTDSKFDRDLMDFEVQIHDLETQLQSFINSAFENISSTEQALNLLQQFQTILQRDTLRADLQDKYMVIFHNYGFDLENVQAVYEKHKNNPPVPRNAPPIAGNIMWARQLLRRIEEPMRKFASNQAIMSSKEAKRVVRVYNRVAQTLIKFEMLWVNYFLAKIERDKAGLQATLLVRHPEDGRLLVNFDRDILQLMREAKYLQRMGIEIPESAKMVLLQEDKFKSYYNQLTHVLKEAECIERSIPDMLQRLMQPHIVDLEQKIQPGLYVLTWTSMNIDAYLHRIHHAMQALDELVRKVSDMLTNRVEANVTRLGRTRLVRLPTDQTVTIDDFKSHQSKMIRARANNLRIKNEEVQRALSDIVGLLDSYPRENTSTSIPQSDVNELRRFYSRQMYESVLKATKIAFSAMKERLAGTASAGFLFVDRPFFDVDVELAVPNITLSPSLEDIQVAINVTAKEVLACSKEIQAWGPDYPPNSAFFEKLAADREIVVSVLLLTGSVESLKKEVRSYLSMFDRFSFLWKTDMQAEYDKFMKTNPSLEAVEVELKKYDDIEQQITVVAPVHNIGCLSIETTRLKTALRQEAAQWKAKFSQNLHDQAQKQLDAFMDYVGQSMKQLESYQKKITKLDLDDVRNVMMLLNEVREREADIDNTILPIEDMYNLLNRFNVPVDKEEQDQVADLNYSWEKLRRLAGDVADRLTELQGGYKLDLITHVREFVADVAKFRESWERDGPMVEGLDPMEANNKLNQFRPIFEAKRTKWLRYQQGEEVFGLPVTKYPELEQTEKEIENLAKLHGLYVEVVETMERYGSMLWVDVVERLQELSETVVLFQSKSNKLPKGSLRTWPAYTDCRKLIDDMMGVMPLLEALASKDIRDRHWEELQRICNKKLNLAEDVLKLKDLLDCRLLDHQEDMEDMVSGASKEATIEKKLAAIDSEWSALELVFATYRQRGEVVLSVSDTADLIEKLEEAQMNLQGMATNRYSQPFRESVHEWVVKLSTVSEVIEQWLTVQNLWTSLEVVFDGGDIVKSLPQEAKRFKTIDAAFMKVVATAQENKSVIETCFTNETLKSMLPNISEQLELCQKALSSYLEDKRAEFPRFYFVSDATLLQVLSVGSDPEKVQPHFESGLFDAVSAITFDKKDKTKIIEMQSRQKEVVPMEYPVDATGTIEVWLQRLVDGMKDTVKAIIKRSTRDVESQQRDEFIFGFPAQVALLGMQLQWTGQVQSALVSAKTKKDVMNQAQKRVGQVLSEMIILTTRELSGNQRTNLETVITVYVHQRDVTDELVKKRIRDPTDFEWLKQARFYWRPEQDTAVISITDAEFEYSYEYLGIKERLVITPLTDICYITLAQALNMCLGGAPAGPAGTGKTETTKDLGNTLGKYVVVFNCGDQFDYIYMGKIFRGLAQSGLWGCFDEFNRINLDVLSVCAQQILCVLTAIREGKKRFVFTDGKEVDLDPRVGYFITMNPGYAGRQELPENLKSLFRGVTMMVPDRSIIMQVKLAACGYQENKMLSKKFFVLYGLCEQQLSKQRHYDFGLRNILSVLRTAGASKRANPGKTEDFLMMRTLRDMNMSKFVSEDVPLFESLISDLFPTVTNPERASFDDVERAVKEVATENGLQLHGKWLKKCTQLYETYLVRHGIMLVGPTGGGKTAIAETLAGALSRVDRKHVIRKMNPKAITAHEMFGKLDNATQDWTDGVFSVLWRRATKDSKSFNTWIVLDGPVDAIWIENLNTVLDDNKVLTLSNGDRILMTPEMKAMFEPENLNNASPATVSRAGIIYVSDDELGWMPIVQSWLRERETKFNRPQDRENLEPLFKLYFEDKEVKEPSKPAYVIPGLPSFVRTACKPVISNQDVCLVQYALDLLEAMLRKPAEEGRHLTAEQYERLFLYCAAWTVGASTGAADRPHVMHKLAELAEQGKRRKRHAPLPRLEDPEDTLFEYVVDMEKFEWVHWASKVPQWKYPKGVERPEYASLVIPTLDSVRVQYLMHALCGVKVRAGGEGSKGRPVMLVGEPGTAKSTVVTSFIRELDPERHTSKMITFSFLTKPRIFQTAIESSLEKNPGRIFRPPGGKQMVVFIDDISMPEVNEWGDQITNELVRQLLEEDGFYQLEKPIGDFKKVERLWYFAAMNTPGGGKNDVPNRLKRQFAIINVPPPSRAAINNIFGTLVSGRFDPSAFDASVAEVAGRLVPMTISLWNAITRKMLPTPAKFHYLFNIRELSKVFQGVILATTERFRAKPAQGIVPLGGGAVTTAGGYLLALWKHECERVFVDKLVNADDKAWAENKITELAVEAFGAASEEVAQIKEPVYFVDWLREPVEDPETGEILDAHPSYYEAVRGGLKEIRERVEKKQGEFNETSRGLKMELVYFDDALMHLMRITRLLAMACGNGLLVGVGGSGKQSLARMAAYISGAFTFQITITKTYSENNLFDDLKNLYKTAGLKGSKVCFLFTDAEVKRETFLEYINQVLMTGEVAGLFPKDEMQAIVADIRPVMKKMSPHTADTPDNLWNFFINRVRENLHVMLCFSPVGVKFSRRAQQFPGLINGCTIDWFMPWPEDALVAVSGKFIGDFAMACDDKVKRSLQRMMGGVHVRVTKACTEYFERFRRHVYVSPKSYLSFVNGYKDLYAAKWKHVMSLASAINAGLQKMKEAKQDVDKLKEELKVMNKEVEVKSRQVKELLQTISEKTTIAEKEKQKANAIADAANKQATEIAAQEAEANRDLAAAEPALQEAERAASSIDPADVKKVMGIRPAPPSLVKRVFDCVLLLKHNRVASPLQYEMNDKVKTLEMDGTVSKATVATEVPVASWDESMRLDPGKVPEDITSFLERGYINDEVIELMYPYVRTEDFWPLIAKGSANALEGICGWARAMVKYYNVAKVVEPKREALRKAQNQLKAAMKEKATADATLAEVQAQVDALQRQYDQAMKEKGELEDQANMCERKMDAAANLIGALSGEEARWNKQSAEFDDTIQRLAGDCALASAFVSYLGPFNKEFRDLLLKREFYKDCLEKNIPVTKNMNATQFLVDDAEVGEWNLDGLPTDELSVQNGIMVTRASRYPVLIDPQGQGKAWIKNREARNQLVVTTITDKYFRNQLEECMSEGKPLLIENIEEELDPVLDPVLERRIIKKGRSMIIQLADKEVEFDPLFRLFCTTRLPSPHFSPELSAKVTVVDFTVTLEGLEDQLLGKLILKERSELEEQRKNLLVEVNDYKKNIKQLEESLLYRLSNSQGNLLDDTELIDVLANTKKTSQEVNTKLQVASETNEKITEACEEFRPVAHRAALIYFLIAEFSTVNRMYQTSLSQFEELYDHGIDRSEKAVMPSKRIKNIIDYLTYSVFLYIQRGLFERHKMIFALMLTNKILVSAGEIKQAEVNIFLKGGSELDINSVRVQKPSGKGKGGESWISDTVWLNLVALSEMRAFSDQSGTGTKGILDSVRQNEQLWNAWYDKEAPEAEQLPEYANHISSFERMCLVKAFREDRTLIAAEEYIAEALGRQFVESVPLNLEKAWEESAASVPLICILSRGADPTKLISDLARKKKKEILGVSMGQGQEIIARGHMKTATEEGHWVLLQNTHLGLKYLSEVEELLVKELDKFHPEFRLWITAEPTDGFPIGLLQLSIKITSEAPMGIKAGMRSSYQWVSQDMLEAVPRQEWRQLLYIMCYVHSIVQERRKFGPIGWNIPYEFNQSDLSACVQFLQNHLLEMEGKKASQPTWETVRYMISVIMYGGRITDDFDQLLMNTYADRYFNQAAMAVGYELFKDVKAGFSYVVPDSTEIEPFRAAIELFPSQDSPEIFGLHSNADLTFRTIQVNDVINTIIDTMPKAGGGSGGESREDKVDRLCQDRLEKVPPVFEREDMIKKISKLGEREPLTVHLRQEIDRLNIVINLTRKTLQNLRLAIAGTIILSPDLVEALNSLYDGRVPPMWVGMSWESSGMGTWFSGLINRYEQLRRWLDNGRPKSYWLTGFFNPQGFLTAALQEVTRAHAKTKDKWALDDVVMESQCTGKKVESLGAAPQEGVYVHGLFLDGCAWSDRDGRLVDAEQKKIVNPLPVLHVTGTVSKKREGTYQCPTYRVKKRTGLNYITKFDLRTDDPVSKWILRGVALLCSID